VFIYHFAGASPACRRFLERAEQGDLKASTSAAALAEVSHRLMMMEAVSLGLVTAGNVAKKLRKKPGAIKKLRKYDENVQRIPLMRIEVLSLDLKTMATASTMRTEYGLMVNDSIMAATAVSAGIEIIATADRDFDRVAELDVAAPGDLGTSPR
jgi:predicted nucleic acid-binding protein